MQEKLQKKQLCCNVVYCSDTVLNLSRLNNGKVSDQKTGIRWNLHNRLKDLEFADSLLTEHCKHLQTNIDKFIQQYHAVRLKINTVKT